MPDAQAKEIQVFYLRDGTYMAARLASLWVGSSRKNAFDLICVKRTAIRRYSNGSLGCSEAKSCAYLGHTRVRFRFMK